MKKLGKKQIEAIAQELLNVPTDESIERMELVKERAFQEYERRQRMKAEAGQLVTSSRGSKVKGLGYRMMTAVAIALAILIIPVVFPAPISVADDDWGRSIAIWLNDTFHTKIQLPDSVYDEGHIYDLAPGEQMVFYQLEDATSYVGDSLLTIGSAAMPCSLQSIAFVAIDERVYRVTERFLFDEVEITIVMKTALDSQVASPLTDATLLMTGVGELAAWESGEESCAIGTTGEWLIQLSAECDLATAVKLFSTVQLFSSHIQIQ